MEGLERRCFQIIFAVGMACSSYIETIQEAKKASFERAREMIEEGDKDFLQGHGAHAKMVQQEAGGEEVKIGLLLIHAGDQLIGAESSKIITDEIVQSYERIIALESKIKQSREENDVKKTYLFYSAGMSTSMLAQEMQNVADAHGLPLEVKACSHSEIGDIIEQLHPDCILFGPRVKYLYEEANRQFKETAPVAVIGASDYSMMNGERVLKTAVKLIKSFKK